MKLFNTKDFRFHLRKNGNFMTWVEGKHWYLFIILTVCLVVLWLLFFVILMPGSLSGVSLLAFTLLYALEGLIAWRFVFGLPVYHVVSSNSTSTTYERGSSDPNAPLYRYRSIFGVLYLLILIILLACGIIFINIF